MNKKNIFKSLVAILVIMQFFQIDKSLPPINPNDILETVANPPENVLAQIKISCYDCHSHETKYPWYTYVAPISYWIKGHINKGREALNFSTWGELNAEDQKHLLHECAEKVEEGHMPPNGYVRMHGEAGLTNEQKKMLVGWFEQNSKHNKD